MTALHWGAFHNRDGHVKLLIEKGAEVLVRDTEGKTPLHLAAQVSSEFSLVVSARSAMLNLKQTSRENYV